MAKKKYAIRTESYVYVGETPVRFDDLTPEQKRAAATELKLRWMRALYPGVEFYAGGEEKST